MIRILITIFAIDVLLVLLYLGTARWLARKVTQDYADQLAEDSDSEPTDDEQTADEGETEADSDAGDDESVSDDLFAEAGRPEDDIGGLLDSENDSTTDTSSTEV